MGANVTVRVKLPDGTPAVGARVRGVNHDAWAKSQKDWLGTTDENGQHVWTNLDTGMLGDRYTIVAEQVDPKGGKLLGEVSERIKHDMEVTIVLAKSPDGASELPESKGRSQK
jgi:hypothetical protein